MPLRLQVLAHNAYPDWPTKHGLSSFSEILSVNKFAYACCPRNETTAHLNFSSLVLKLSFARLTEQLTFALCIVQILFRSCSFSCQWSRSEPSPHRLFRNGLLV